MDDPYRAGQSQGYGYGTGDRSLSISMIDYNVFQQQQAFIAQQNLSPAIRPRHDSVNSQVSPRASQLLAGQHQAENQPRRQQLTPQTSTAYSELTAMSRDASHASHRSSTSSSLQFRGSLHFGSHNPTPNVYSPIAAGMQRTGSAFSDTSTLHSHHFSPRPSIPQTYQRPVNNYGPDSTDELTADSSTMAQYRSMYESVDDAAMDYNLIGINGFGCFGNNDFGISTPGRHMYTSAISTPLPRPRATSFGGYTQHPYHRTAASLPQITHPVAPPAASSPASSQSSTPIDQPKRHRQKRTPTSDSESERITGHVLASGKFKCSDPKCDDLRFGRQADFRRHHTNMHADKKIEYFCTVAGCDRSRKPSKKSKGRSFGARKDKMEEHVQTVHAKESRKRKRSPETEVEEDDEDNEDVEPSSDNAQQHS